MSLYKWLVDYVFIPLGGSRASQPRVFLNVLITMFLSGLWHGAGLNFIVWGLWHGMLLVVHRGWTLWRRERAGPPGRFAQLSSWAITFLFVNMGWSFFCMDLHTSVAFWKRLLLG